MARLGMEVKEVSPLEYGVHQPGHEAVSAGMNAQQVEELTVAYIVRWQHRHLTREPTIGWVERFGCLATDPGYKQAHLPITQRIDRKSNRLNSSHQCDTRMPS